MEDMEKPKVSVIVAVYNAERFLRQCLNSIVNQTLKNIEIICVNDGSTDNSLSILKEYAKVDSRLRIFTKENEGLGGASARNLGLEHAVGEYISILDSDDFFELNMLEKAVNKADETNADFVIFGGYEYNDKEKVHYKTDSILNEKLLPEKEVFSYKDFPKKIYQITSGMAWNQVYRKTFLDKYKLKFQHIKYTDDAYFTFSYLVLAKKIAAIKECLCYYRINAGTSQTDGLSNYPDSAYMPYLKLKESLIKWGMYEEVKQSFINCTTVFLRYFYDKITNYNSFEYLHNKYRNEIFDQLEIADKLEEYFYDKRIYMWCRQVIENSAGELVFKSARAYGNMSTTGILRFQIPYEIIPRNSKIVIVGAGIVGQHYYAQLILNGYCDVVLWVSQADESLSHLSCVKHFAELMKIDFDYILISYERSNMINSALSILHQLGISDDKIIMGGGVVK